VLKVEINLRTMLFLTVAAINGIRRKLFELLLIERDKNRPHLQRSESSKMLTYPAAKLDYRANVVNKLAAKFYRESGVEIIEPGFELLAEASGLEVMRMKYCIKEELNICPKQNKTNTHYTEPLYLKSFARKYRLVFDCLRCEMGVVAEEK
jgi:putative protease